MNFSQDCCFFLNLVHSSESKKKLDLGRNFMRTTTTIISSMVSIPWFYSISMYTSVNYCSIHNKTYIQYLLLYVYIYICAPHNISIWFSILGNKHFVGTTHEQHVYKKTLSLSKISSFGRFLLSTNGWSRWSRVPWVMGVWNLGVGAVGQNSVQGWVPGKISPGGKKEHMIQYTILKTHESPLKRGASSKGKDCFTICYFSGDMWMFFGGVFVGV